MTSMDFGIELNYHGMFLIGKKWPFFKAKTFHEK